MERYNLLGIAAKWKVWAFTLLAAISRLYIVSSLITILFVLMSTRWRWLSGVADAMPRSRRSVYARNARGGTITALCPERLLDVPPASASSTAGA